MTSRPGAPAMIDVHIHLTGVPMHATGGMTGAGSPLQLIQVSRSDYPSLPRCLLLVRLTSMDRNVGLLAGRD